MAVPSGPRGPRKLKTVPVHRLERGRLQPRQAIDPVALTKLAESVKSEGVIQPLFVRRVGLGRFEIVAGERRWHAAKMAGLKDVPTLIGKVSDESALAIALVENLHREDLNPIDQALAVQRLVGEFSMTHQQVAETIGRSRAWVSNLLRLLDLPEDVQALVAEGQIDMGHARALLALPRNDRASTAQRVVKQQLSVRYIENLSKSADRAAAQSCAMPATASAATVRDAPLQLAALVREGVALKPNHGGRWQLRIDFAGLAELREKLERLASDCSQLTGVSDSVE
jgi:ParB family chromosome partitioning protein